MQNTPKRILFVYPEPYFLSSGGIATYLHHAVRAHLAAGREVHVLTWLTPEDPLFDQHIDDKILAPLDRSHVTILKSTFDDVNAVNATAPKSKNISELLAQEVERLEAQFRPDIIEGSDYKFPLHTYLERRRSGAVLSHAQVITFCHGQLKNIYPASALMPGDLALREIMCEQQVIEWADYVFAPSMASFRDVIRSRRSNVGVHLVREPYTSDNWRLAEEFLGTRFIYFGRVSFAKGVDLFAGMMTAIASLWPVMKITFLGRLVNASFTRKDMVSYLLARISEDLHSRTEFRSSVDRAELPNVLRGYDFFANFSRAETFSYTTLEAISEGVVPLVLIDSPMSEFIPGNVRAEATFSGVPHRSEAIAAVLEFWRTNYHQTMAAVQAHAATLTDPTTYAAAYREIVPKRSNVARLQYTSRDITVLISTHNDARLLLTALSSIEAQTAKVREVLVLDDGSTDSDAVAVLRMLAQDERVRVLTVRNMGLVAGRNVLVENATTDLVVFLDADDYLAPTFVEATLKALNTDPDGLSAATTRRKNFGLNNHEMSCVLLGTPLHWLVNELRMTALIKRSTLQEIRFDPALRNGEADDWLWWLRFTIHGKRAVQVPEPLFHYRTVAGSMSLPWSEGQGALTMDLLSRAASEAAERGVDVTLPFQWALSQAYRRTFQLDAVGAQQSSQQAMDRRIVLRNRLSRMLGEKNLQATLRLGRGMLRRYPWMVRPVEVIMKPLGVQRQSS